jgi:photosystem II stability/assembly factor-like uncharacterized protein
MTMRPLLLAVSLIAATASAPRAIAQAPYDSAMFRALQWRNIVPNRGGRVTTAVGVPGNPRVYYIGATGGGIWKTEDAGGRWRNVSDGYLTSGSIGDIAVFAGNPSVLYASTGERPVRGQMSSYGDGVYKSTDAGLTWSHIGLDSTRQIGRVVIHPANSDVVYVAAQGSRWAPTDARGVYRTTDGGKSWKRVLFVSRGAGASDLAMDPTNPSILFATTWDMQRTPWAIRSGGPGSAIWKTTDGGDTWTRLGNGLPARMGRIGIAIAPSMPNRVYALVEADSGGVFRTDDGGNSWRQVSASRGVLARAWYFMSVTVDPKNPDVVHAPGFALLRSTDGGVTFATRPSPHSDNHRVWINPGNSDNMVLATDGGAAVSFDGGANWSTVANQPTAQLYAVQADDLFPYNLYSGQQDYGSIRMSSRGGGGGDQAFPQNWQSVGGGESARFAFDPRAPDVIYATGFLGELHRLDQRTGFTRAVSEFPGGQHLGSAASDMPYRFHWNAPLTWSPFDPSVIYHGANVLFRTTDGDTWVPISGDLTRNDPTRHGRSGPFWHDGAGGEIYNTITIITPSPRERGTIWVGTDDGLVQLTRDEGKTWRNVTPPAWGEGWIHNIDAGRHADGTAYVAFSRIKWDDYRPRLFVTRDYGTTWTDLGATLPQGHPARVVREDPVRKDLLFAGTERGLWMSFDGGTQWQAFPRSVPSVAISDLLIHHDDLVVATEGRGYWILDDMTPLRQFTPALFRESLVLFAPRQAVRTAGNPRGGSLAGTAPIRYWLSRPLSVSDTVKLEIVNAAGTVVRRVGAAGAAAVADTAGGGARAARPTGAPQLGTARGLHQFTWDFRGRETETGGMVAMRPGSYVVRMTLGGSTVSHPLPVIADPRAGSTPAAEGEHFTMSLALAKMIDDVNGALADLRNVRTQARAQRQAGLSPARDNSIRGLVRVIDSLEAIVVSGSMSRDPGGLDILHNAPRLLGDLSGLLTAADGSSGPVTSGEREQLARLQTRVARFLAAVERVLTTEVARVNGLGAEPKIERRVGPPPS